VETAAFWPERIAARSLGPRVLNSPTTSGPSIAFANLWDRKAVRRRHVLALRRVEKTKRSLNFFLFATILRRVWNLKEQDPYIYLPLIWVMTKDHLCSYLCFRYVIIGYCLAWLVWNGCPFSLTDFFTIMIS
jgi:hypothetical protein